MKRSTKNRPCTEEAVSEALAAAGFSFAHGVAESIPRAGAQANAQADAQANAQAGALANAQTDAKAAMRPARLLANYLTMLEKWNKAMNLVGPSGWESIFATLIVDSLHLARLVRSLPLPGEPLCRDLGSGAGLPGLPLRMFWAEGSYALIEAREKRSLFMKSYLAANPLPGVTVFHGRAEGYMAENPAAHLTVSRAFMPWENMLSLIAPHTQSGGLCVFLTLTGAPENVPHEWKLFGQQAYRAERQERYFWIMEKR